MPRRCLMGWDLAYFYRFFLVAENVTVSGSFPRDPCIFFAPGFSGRPQGRCDKKKGLKKRSGNYL